MTKFKVGDRVKFKSPHTAYQDVYTITRFGGQAPYEVWLAEITGWFDAEALELVPKFKVGDKVRRTPSSIGWNDPEIYEVSQVNAEGRVTLRDWDPNHWMSPQTLEYVASGPTEEAKPKLKVGDKVRWKINPSVQGEVTGLTQNSSIILVTCGDNELYVDPDALELDLSSTTPAGSQQTETLNTYVFEITGDTNIKLSGPSLLTEEAEKLELWLDHLPLPIGKKYKITIEELETLEPEDDQIIDALCCYLAELRGKESSKRLRAGKVVEDLDHILNTGTVPEPPLESRVDPSTEDLSELHHQLSIALKLNDVSNVRHIQKKIKKLSEVGNPQD